MYQKRTMFTSSANDENKKGKIILYFRYIFRMTTINVKCNQDSQILYTK